MTTNLRSKLIRLARAKPELRPALLPLLKTGSFPRIVKEVEDDYRRKAITVSEKNELLAAIEDAETEQEAKKLVADHRKGRVASSLQRSDVPEFLAKELAKIPGFKVKTSPGGKMTLAVGGALNPEVKSIEFTDLDKDRAPFRMHLKNGLSGWGWDTARHVFYDDKNELRLGVVFDGKRDPEAELRAFIQNVLLEGIRRAGTSIKGLEPVAPSVNPAKAQADELQKKLQAVGVKTRIEWRDGHSQFISAWSTLSWGVTNDDSKLFWFFGGEKGELPLRKGEIQRLKEYADPILTPKVLNRLVRDVKAAFIKLEEEREGREKAREEAATKAKRNPKVFRTREGDFYLQFYHPQKADYIWTGDKWYSNFGGGVGLTKIKDPKMFASERDAEEEAEKKAIPDLRWRPGWEDWVVGW